MTKIECNKYLPSITKVECYLIPKNRSVKLLTGYMEFSEPITALLVNIALSFKNSRNIYNLYANQTFDYCDAVGTTEMNYFAIIQQIINNVDPLILKKCPLINFFGAKNVTINSSVLDNYPLYTLPSKDIKLYLAGRFF